MFGALASLALLVYGGVSVAFSVSVSDADAEANSGPTGGIPSGWRALVVPVTDASLVPTHANERDASLGHAGAFVVHGKKDGFLPVTARDTAVGRALLHVSSEVSAEANASAEPRLVNLTNVLLPHPDAANGTGNLTLNLSAIPAGESGFFLKPDHAENATWVADAAIVGQVIRFEPPSRAYTVLGGAALALVFSLIGLFTTHSGAGVRGAPGIDLPESNACRECRAPLAANESFCMRCGAWKEHRQS